jgi:hypothetical protein
MSTLVFVMRKGASVVPEHASLKCLLCEEAEAPRETRGNATAYSTARDTYLSRAPQAPQGRPQQSAAARRENASD